MSRGIKRPEQCFPDHVCFIKVTWGALNNPDSQVSNQPQCNHVSGGKSQASECYKDPKQFSRARKFGNRSIKIFFILIKRNFSDELQNIYFREAKGAVVMLKVKVKHRGLTERANHILCRRKSSPAYSCDARPGHM